MNFPDLTVKNIIDQMTKKSSSKDLDFLSIEINKLQSFERCQLFCLIKDIDNFPRELFSLEITIWNRINEIFRGEYSESTLLVNNCEITLFLAENGLLCEIFDLEDYRAVIRFLYTNVEDYKMINLLLNKSILHFLYFKGIKESILTKFQLMLQFLGIPLANVDEIENDLKELFPQAKSEVEAFLDLPIGTIQKYPEYLDETVEQLCYDEIVPLLKKWVNNEILSRIEKIKVNQLTNNWIPHDISSLDELIVKLELKLSEEKMTSIPIVYDSFVKPYCSLIKPEKIVTTDLDSTIPPKILQTYVEKLAYPLSVLKGKEIKIFFLGGATIGMTAILICTPRSNVLIDYGISVANYQIPYWNEALNHLDAILVTHAHLDHVGAIPYLFGLGYDGYVFGSTMSKNLANMLLFDSLELMNKNFSSAIRKSDHRFKFLSQPQYIYKMLDHYVTIKSKNEFKLASDLIVKAFPANHIQGSYSYVLKCGDKEILYTGDMNMDQTSLFKDKQLKLPTDADLTIVDSTYYGQPSFNAKERDFLLLKTVKENKKVIIPAFSVGRAQEIMIKLDKAGITKERKITMLGMATKVARVTGMKTNGYLSDYLSQPFEDEVVITGGGMLNGGYARELVEQTKDDPDTTIILSGYLAKSTLGYRLLHGLEPDYKQKVVFTRFSGHSSSDSLIKYLNSVREKKVLVHIGDLTSDPFTTETLRKKKLFLNPDYYIPDFGTSISI